LWPLPQIVVGARLPNAQMRNPRLAFLFGCLCSSISEMKRSMTLAKGHLSLLILTALALTSCQSDDKPPQPRYTSNASGAQVAKASQREGQYFIEFRSRYALTYGHTSASPDAAPYVLGHFIPVPASTGATDGDLEEAYRSASWRILLTEAEYNKTVAYIRDLQAKSKMWQATVDNCNNFVGEIASSMGYKTPSIWLRPQEFITKLREMNT
jgi:hypothetical protein